MDAGSNTGSLWSACDLRGCDEVMQVNAARSGVLDPHLPGRGGRDRINAPPLGTGPNSAAGR